MNRRTFTIGIAAAILVVDGAAAQGMGPADREQMRKRWDEMDHENRSKAMERMRGHRHEPKYEDMRERWDKMSPDDRRRMMERHDKRHGEMHK